MFWPANRIQRLDNYKPNLESLYGHLNYHSYAACFQPMFFMTNRIVFTIGCWLIQEPAIQIPIYSSVTLFDIAYLLHVRP